MHREERRRGSGTIRTMSRFLWIAVAAGLACVSGSVTAANEPTGLRAAAERWSVHIVTQDPDGDERVTRIWLAALAGVGVIRTGDSRWWRNLERDRNCRIRVSGTDTPVRVEFVAELEEKARIDDVFLEKYGWQERAFIWGDRGETHENYMRVHAADPGLREN